MKKDFELIYKNNKINYTINKSKRKTITISIKNDKTIILKIPHRVTYAYGEKIIKEKAPWILEKLATIKTTTINLENGGLFLGEKINILEKHDNEFKHNFYFFNNGNLSIYNLNKYSVEDIYKKFLIEKGKEIIPFIIEHFSSFIDKKPEKLRVKFLKSSWGICYSNKSITINAKLLMAPKYVLEYVVFHEMVHLVHMNHSKKFWHLVNEHLPNYKNAKIWLKSHGSTLHI